MESYGERDCNYAPMPGDDSDGTCQHCGAPVDETGVCPDQQCREYQERDENECRYGVGWNCSQACSWCGRC